MCYHQRINVISVDIQCISIQQIQNSDDGITLISSWGVGGVRCLNCLHEIF